MRVASARSRINSAPRHQFGRRRSSSRAKAASSSPRRVSSSSYVRCCCCCCFANAVAAQLIRASVIVVVRAALSIYVIQRCAMPFTGENMKTPLCASRCCSPAFRIVLPPPSFPPARTTLLFLFGYLSYVFALRTSSRAFPREESVPLLRGCVSLLFSFASFHAMNRCERNAER